MKFFDFFPFVSFLFYSILIIGNSVFLKRKGIRVSSKSGKSKRMKYILHPFFLFIMHLWMFEISRPVFHISLLPKIITNPLLKSYSIKIFGTILILVSIGLLIATLINLRDSFRFGLNSNNLGKLITTGVFAFSRNPFFVSIEFLIIGNALLFPSLFLVGFAVATIVGIHFFIMKEERFMQENYGTEYKNYSKKTRRYL